MSREDTAAPSGHSTTSQWQSFEMRMRRRRAERCVLHAEAALEAGNPEDARAAVEEARLLDASTPEFDTLCAAVAERQQAAMRRNRVQSVRRLAVAAVIIVIAVVGIGVWQRDSSPLAPVAVATTRETSPSQQATATRVEPQAAQFAVVSEPPGPATTTNGDSTVAPAPASTPPALSPASLSPPAVGREVEIAAHAVPAGRNTSDLGTPIPGLPMPALPEVAAAPAIDEAARVRAVLSNYELAYTALNGLESQRMSLGNCSVAIEGASARADCNGTATWTPRIGGGTQSAARSWRFELKHVAGQWQIVRADVR